jgi:hypothetical protein
MIQWEYQVTMHEMPERQAGKEKSTIECDQDGLCFVHDVFQGGIEWVENLFREKGEEGWELVQFGYHNQELLCIWKRKKESKSKTKRIRKK